MSPENPDLELANNSEDLSDRLEDVEESLWIINDSEKSSDDLRLAYLKIKSLDYGDEDTSEIKDKYSGVLSSYSELTEWNFESKQEYLDLSAKLIEDLWQLELENWDRLSYMDIDGSVFDVPQALYEWAKVAVQNIINEFKELYDLATEDFWALMSALWDALWPPQEFIASMYNALKDWAKDVWTDLQLLKENSTKTWYAIASIELMSTVWVIALVDWLWPGKFLKLFKIDLPKWIKNKVNNEQEKIIKLDKKEIPNASEVTINRWLKEISIEDAMDILKNWEKPKTPKEIKEVLENLDNTSWQMFWNLNENVLSTSSRFHSAKMYSFGTYFDEWDYITHTPKLTDNIKSALKNAWSQYWMILKHWGNTITWYKLATRWMDRIKWTPEEVLSQMQKYMKEPDKYDVNLIYSWKVDKDKVAISWNNLDHYMLSWWTSREMWVAEGVSDIKYVEAYVKRKVDKSDIDWNNWVDRSIVEANSKLEIWDRLVQAKKLLGVDSLTKEQHQAIIKAHYSWDSGVYNYSEKELLAKSRILSEKWPDWKPLFSKEQRRVLMENGITGEVKINTTKIPTDKIDWFKNGLTEAFNDSEMLDDFRDLWLSDNQIKAVSKNLENYKTTDIWLEQSIKELSELLDWIDKDDILDILEDVQDIIWMDFDIVDYLKWVKFYSDKIFRKTDKTDIINASVNIFEWKKYVKIPDITDYPIEIAWKKVRIHVYEKDWNWEATIREEWSDRLVKIQKEKMQLISDNPEDAVKQLVKRLDKHWENLRPALEWSWIKWIHKAPEIDNDIVRANFNLSDDARKQKARELIWDITPEQENAIIKAHETWKSWVYEYNEAELLQKIRILRQAWLTREQTKILMQNGITWVSFRKIKESLPSFWKKTFEQVKQSLDEKNGRWLLAVPEISNWDEKQVITLLNEQIRDIKTDIWIEDLKLIDRHEFYGINSRLNLWLNAKIWNLFNIVKYSNEQWFSKVLMKVDKDYIKLLDANMDTYTKSGNFILMDGLEEKYERIKKYINY